MLGRLEMPEEPILVEGASFQDVENAKLT